MNFTTTNELPIGDLRAAIREGKKTCGVTDCDRQATDVHHLDGDHSNNAPENLTPICKLCHDEIHGISADMNELKLLTREFYAVQDQRKALSNRIGAYERLDLPVTYARQAFKDIEETEDKLERYIKAMLKHNAFYNAWLKHVKGIGPRLSASLMADLGSPERFNTVGQLWAYAGMHVVDGEAPRRQKGEHANWNHTLRMTLWKTSSQFMKTPKSFGRQLYLQYKQYYIERDGAEPKWKPHKRALRRVSKDFLRCLWRAWMKARELPLSEPHPNTQVLEDDWICE